VGSTVRPGPTPARGKELREPRAERDAGAFGLLGCFWGLVLFLSLSFSLFSPFLFSFFFLFFFFLFFLSSLSLFFFLFLVFFFSLHTVLPPLRPSLASRVKELKHFPKTTPPRRPAAGPASRSGPGEGNKNLLGIIDSFAPWQSHGLWGGSRCGGGLSLPPCPAARSLRGSAE